MLQFPLLLRNFEKKRKIEGRKECQEKWSIIIIHVGHAEASNHPKMLGHVRNI